MDRPDRMPGPSAQSSALREGRRPVPNSAATSNGPPPASPLPISGFRNDGSNALASAANTTSSLQVIAMAREAMQHAIESEKSQAVEAGAVGTASLRSGVTIDLSRKNIQKLPEEVVDIVKEQLER